MTPPSEIIKIAADVAELAERMYVIAKQPTTNEDELQHIGKRLEDIRDQLNSFEPEKADIPAQTPDLPKVDLVRTIKPAASPSNPAPFNNPKGGTPALGQAGNPIDKRPEATTPQPTPHGAASVPVPVEDAGGEPAAEVDGGGEAEIADAARKINEGLPASSKAGPGEAPAFDGVKDTRTQPPPGVTTIPTEKDQRAPDGEKQLASLSKAEEAGKLPDKDRRAIK